MANRSLLSRWTLVSGILLTLLGLIHNLATPHVHREVYSKLPRGEALAGDIFFVATGSALILLGLLTVYASRALDRAEPWAFTVTSAAGAYVTLLGGAAVAVMPSNPFTYVSLALGGAQLIPLWINRRNLRPAARIQRRTP